LQFNRRSLFWWRHFASAKDVFVHVLAVERTSSGNLTDGQRVTC